MSYIHTYIRHGHDDCDILTQKGIAQVEASAAKLKEIYAGKQPFVFTSRNNRAIQTGEILAKSLDGILQEPTRELSDERSLLSISYRTNVDAIFVSHRPDIQNATGRELDNAQFIIQYR